MTDEKTIAAIATPAGVGSLSVIRVSGVDAITLCDKVFKGINGKPLSEKKGYTASFGAVFDGDEKIDDCVSLVFRAPKSYTGEDVVELSVHGSLVSAKLTLRALFAAGCTPAGPGEFTRRAYINGKMDLTQAESVMSIINANGNTALSAAVNTLDGKIQKQIDDCRAVLTELSARLEMWCDSPDDDYFRLDVGEFTEKIENCRDRLKRLVDEFDSARAICEGLDTAIVGKPNAGKSTLMNLLLGLDRSIVSAVPGTTRDTVEETCVVGDVTLRLCDTAGIHDSSDEVEAIGIERAEKKIERCEFVIAVFDGSSELSDEDISILEKCKGKTSLAVINKDDLPQRIDEGKIGEYAENVLTISAKNTEDKIRLTDKINEILIGSEIDVSQGLLSSERQRMCADEAVRSLTNALDGLKAGVTFDAVSVDITNAIQSLLALTGRVAREEIIDDIFSKFCVGK